MNDKLSEEASGLPLEMWNFCCSLSNVLKLSCTAWDIFWVVPGVSGGTVVVEGISGKKRTKHKLGYSPKSRHTHIQPRTLLGPEYGYSASKIYSPKQAKNKKKQKKQHHHFWKVFLSLKIPETWSKWWKFLRSILTGWSKLKTVIRLCITTFTTTHINNLFPSNIYISIQTTTRGGLRLTFSYNRLMEEFSISLPQFLKKSNLLHYRINTKHQVLGLVNHRIVLVQYFYVFHNNTLQDSYKIKLQPNYWQTLDLSSPFFLWFTTCILIYIYEQ